MCQCGICGQPFPDHSSLVAHIFRDHGQRRLSGIIALIIVLLIVGFVNWNSGVVKAQQLPEPSPTAAVGQPPAMPVYVAYLPQILSNVDVTSAVNWRGNGSK